MMTTPSHAHRGTHWAPETRLGTWALSLAGLALGGTVAVAIAFAAGVDSGDTFTDNWLLSMTGVAILACAAGSAVTGVMARVRRHDHSWSVVSATVVGVLLTALMLQQVAEGLGWMSG